MKYLKTYEKSLLGENWKGNYIIVENFSMFRAKNISIILFKIECFIDSGSDKTIEVTQLSCYSENELISFPTNYPDFVKARKDHPSIYYYLSIEPHILYQTDNLEDAETMLDAIHNSTKYNL